MSDITTIWSEILPEVKNGVTGVGVWQALNQARAVTLDESTFVLGMPHDLSDLAGHLRLQQTKALIERMLSQRLEQPIQLRVIDGIAVEDYQNIKRRDAEAQRLQEQALNRQRAEVAARSSWDTIYDQVSRKFAAVQNKSLPQNRAAFLEEALDLMVDALGKMPLRDDLGERNYARCIERISSYSEVPGVIVALMIKQRTGA